MKKHTSAADFLPERLNLTSLRDAAEHCRGCDLYLNATQTVFGAGSRRAKILLVGETPGDFIQRVRLERAANHLVKNPTLPITDIALTCGFGSSAAFARSFKKHFGVSASQYRTEQGQFTAQNNSGLPDLPPHYSAWLRCVQVCEKPDYPVIYVSNLEGYSLEKICLAWERLYRWASARGLITPQTLAIGVSYDDPWITPKLKCRYSACLTVSEKVTVQEPVGTMQIDGGRYAACRVTCTPEEIQFVYRAIYGPWLLGSGLQLADRPAYEIYHQTPDTHPEGKYDLEVCLPLIDHA